MLQGENYTLNINKLTINGEDTYNKSNIVTYRNTGGTENAFLSLLVLGLSNYNVTYGLIGGEIGLKFYSNSEYKKHHAAISQIDMHKHYQAAENSNLVFYTCIGIVAIIWIYDIIWVWKTGSDNNKAVKAYKSSDLSIFYQQNYLIP